MDHQKNPKISDNPAFEGLGKRQRTSFGVDVATFYNKPIL